MLSLQAFPATTWFIQCEEGALLINWRRPHFAKLKTTPRGFFQSTYLCRNSWGRDVAQLVERRTGTPLKQVRCLVRQEVFLPQSTFSADSFTVSVQPYCAIACLSIRAHVRRSQVLTAIPLFGHTNIPHTLLHCFCSCRKVTRIFF